MNTTRDPIAAVLEWGGGTQTALASKLGVSIQVVNNWCRRGQIPSAWLIRIERLSNGELSAVNLAQPAA